MVINNTNNSKSVNVFPEQNFQSLCVRPEPMVPKVLINPQFSFEEMSKTATDMKDHLDDVCKTELGKISKTGGYV